MGQQQILILILAACIAGITASAGIIVLQSDPIIESREAIVSELARLAAEAQAYRVRHFEEGGGDGTYIGLTATPQGIARLTTTHRTPHAEYSIATSGSSRSVRIAALGYSPGINPRKPIRMLMTVFPESTLVAILN